MTKIHNWNKKKNELDEKLAALPVIEEDPPEEPTGPEPFLQAYLVPLDRFQKVPAAVHICQNMSRREDKVEENSMKHTVLASSNEKGLYLTDAEVGCACALPDRLPPVVKPPTPRALTPEEEKAAEGG